MKSALLIIDVQEALCTGDWAVFDIDRIVDRITPLAERVRSSGGIVVLVQHEETEGLLVPETPGWQLYSRVDCQPEDLRVRKATGDAFQQTDLLAILKDQGIERLIACGLQSELCIDATVRGALARNFPVTVVGDAHTTVSGGGLSAAQISAQQNQVFAELASLGAPLTVVSAADVKL